MHYLHCSQRLRSWKFQNKGGKSEYKEESKDRREEPKTWDKSEGAKG
jgi:hypothetical protein